MPLFLRCRPLRERERERGMALALLNNIVLLEFTSPGHHGRCKYTLLTNVWLPTKEILETSLFSALPY